MATDSATDRGARPKTISAMTPWTPITDRPGPKATIRPPTKHQTASVPTCSQSDPAVSPATTADTDSPAASATMADGARRGPLRRAANPTNSAPRAMLEVDPGDQNVTPRP